MLTPNFGLLYYINRMNQAADNAVMYKLDSQSDRAKAERLWTKQYDDTKKCIHVQPCRRKHGECEYDCRTYQEAIVAGTILPLWKALTSVTTSSDGRSAPRHMRVTRLRHSDGTRIVGIKLPYWALRNWRGVLERAGVQVDAGAAVTIDLVEKDATAQEKRATGDSGDKSADPNRRDRNAAKSADKEAEGAGA